VKDSTGIGDRVFILDHGRWEICQAVVEGIDPSGWPILRHDNGGYLSALPPRSVYSDSSELFSKLHEMLIQTMRIKDEE